MNAGLRTTLAALPRRETAAVVVAIALLVAVGLAKDRAREVVRYDSYSSYDAASGGYRAFYELLEREGVRVQRFRERPAFLDASLDTLLWAEPLPFDPAQGETTEADARALEAWVRSGGRLLYVGHDDVAAARRLLQLPFARTRDRHVHARRVAPELRSAGASAVASTAPLRWAPHRGQVTLLDDGAGPLVVRYGFGRGSVVAVIDERLFENAGIARADRARLAVALATPTRTGGALAFDETVHGYGVPRHWWSVVPRRFLIALSLAAVALLVAFMGAALRLGPPVLPVPRDDRSSADFIDGLASLLQRGGAVRGTLGDALASTSRAVVRSLGLGAAASNDEIAAGIASGEMRAAYRELVAVATSAASEANLVRGAALAQRIRKEFVAHGSE